MSEFKKRLQRFAEGLDKNFDVAAQGLRKRLSADDPLEVITYRSYGNVNRLYVKGRVLKDKGILKSTDKDTIWNNIVSMYKRFESDEVPGAKLSISFQNEVYLVTTDHE